MRIAQVAPIWERVPPAGYGGIELMVGHLSNELVRRGHQVTEAITTPTVYTMHWRFTPANRLPSQGIDNVLVQRDSFTFS
jgi:hypothetical protein